MPCLNLGINTSTEEMISADVKFRRDRIAYVRAFPEFRETIVAVVEGAAPERVEQAAADLAAALRADGATFRRGRLPCGRAVLRRATACSTSSPTSSPS